MEATGSRSAKRAKLCAEVRRAHLQRVLHAHAIHFWQHSTGQVVIDIGLTHPAVVGDPLAYLSQPTQMLGRASGHGPE